MRKILMLLVLFLLIAGTVLAMSYKQYPTIEGNGNSSNQTMSVIMGYPNTRVVFDYEASANMTATPMTVYYQLLERGDWISAGSPTLNGTTESDLVVDIDTEGITDLKFVGNATCNATVFQFETGVAQKHWQ